MLFKQFAGTGDRSELERRGPDSIADVGRIVPEADDGAIRCLLVSDDTQGGGVEREVLAGGGGEVEPAGGQNAEEMAAGEEQGGRVESAEAGDDAIGAGGDVGDGFAVWAAIAEDTPR